MIRKTIINDSIIYAKLKVSGLRTDVYYNRNGCNNSERGHFVIKNGKVAYNRPAPALGVFLSGSSLFLNISGGILLPILNIPSSP